MSILLIIFSRNRMVIPVKTLLCARDACDYALTGHLSGRCCARSQDYQDEIERGDLCSQGVHSQVDETDVAPDGCCLV